MNNCFNCSCHIILGICNLSLKKCTLLQLTAIVISIFDYVHNTYHRTYLSLYFPKIFSTFLLIPEVLFWKLSQNKLKLVYAIVQQYCNKKEFFSVDDCYSCDQGIPRFFQVTYWRKIFSFIMFNSNLDCYWARRSSNNQIQILYEIKNLDETSTTGSSIDSNR